MAIKYLQYLHRSLKTNFYHELTQYIAKEERRRTHLLLGATDRAARAEKLDYAIECERRYQESLLELYRKVREVIAKGRNFLVTYEVQC